VCKIAALATHESKYNRYEAESKLELELELELEPHSPQLKRFVSRQVPVGSLTLRLGLSCRCTKKAQQTERQADRVGGENRQIDRQNIGRYVYR